MQSLDEEQLAKYNDLQKQNKELEAASEAQKSHNSDNEADDNDSDGNEDSSSEDETQSAPNNVAAENADSDSDEVSFLLVLGYLQGDFKIFLAYIFSLLSRISE